MKKSILLLLILLLIFVSVSTARILPVEFIPIINEDFMISDESKTVVGCGETKTEYSVMVGKFGSLVLNALPKGNLPSSGPSKKSHNFNT
ncbi:unnamed protein product [Cochlearia groenlandica]